MLIKVKHINEDVKNALDCAGWILEQERPNCPEIPDRSMAQIYRFLRTRLSGLAYKIHIVRKFVHLLGQKCTTRKGYT